MSPPRDRVAHPSGIGLSHQAVAPDPSTALPRSRRRADISCDRCKSRKAKCSRLGDAYSPCRSCIEAGKACQSNFPRKYNRAKTSHPPVAKDNERTRALDSVLTTLYPSRSFETVEDIYEFLAEITPSIGEASRSMVDSGTPRLSHTSVDNSEGELLPSTHVSYHYIGPAGSGQFVNVVKQLVAERNKWTIPVGPHQLAAHLRAAQYLNVPLLRTLDAQTPEHPITHAMSATSGPLGALSSRPDLGLSYTWLDWVRPHIPPRAISNQLVQSFFDIVHPNFPLFHRSHFQEQYEALWTTSQGILPGQTNTETTGWCNALLIVLVLGAQASERSGLPDATRIQTCLLNVIMRHCLQQLLLVATVANVQALLLLQLYLHNTGQRNLAWVLLGHAGRMATALGMHLKVHHRSADTTGPNIRRLTWLTYLLFEHESSFALGRPTMDCLLETKIDLPDDETFGTFSPAGLLGQFLALARIGQSVKRQIATSTASYTDHSKLVRMVPAVELVIQRLQTWALQLPIHLTRDYRSPSHQHHRAKTLLHIYSQHLLSVLCRSYALHRIINQDDRTPTSCQIQVLADTANEAAIQVLRLMLSLHERNLLEGEVWLDVYYFFHACVVLCVARVGSKEDHPPTAEIVCRAVNAVNMTKKSPTYETLADIGISLATLVGLYTTQSDLESSPVSFDAGDTARFVASDFDWENLLGSLPVDGSAVLP